MWRSMARALDLVDDLLGAGVLGEWAGVVVPALGPLDDRVGQRTTLVNLPRLSRRPGLRRSQGWRATPAELPPAVGQGTRQGRARGCGRALSRPAPHRQRPRSSTARVSTCVNSPAYLRPLVDAGAEARSEGTPPRWRRPHLDAEEGSNQKVVGGAGNDTCLGSDHHPGRVRALTLTVG